MISESRLWRLEGGPAIGAEKGGENEKKMGSGDLKAPQPEKKGARSQFLCKIHHLRTGTQGRKSCITFSQGTPKRSNNKLQRGP